MMIALILQGYVYCRKSTTYSSANLFFQKSAFAITRGLDADENPIQDKLGGAMEHTFTIQYQANKLNYSNDWMDRETVSTLC